MLTFMAFSYFPSVCLSKTLICLSFNVLCNNYTTTTSSTSISIHLILICFGWTGHIFLFLLSLSLSLSLSFLHLFIPLPSYQALRWPRLGWNKIWRIYTLSLPACLILGWYTYYVSGFKRSCVQTPTETWENVMKCDDAQGVYNMSPYTLWGSSLFMKGGRFRKIGHSDFYLPPTPIVCLWISFIPHWTRMISFIPHWTCMISFTPPHSIRHMSMIYWLMS